MKVLWRVKMKMISKEMMVEIILSMMDELRILDIIYVMKKKNEKKKKM